jgi:hypothetical protein
VHFIPKRENNRHVLVLKMEIRHKWTETAAINSPLIAALTNRDVLTACI